MCGIGSVMYRLDKVDTVKGGANAASYSLLQVAQGAARVATPETAAPGVGGAFNFKAYMAERAEQVNKALDEAMPLQYPQVITEAMRCALFLGAEDNHARNEVHSD